MSAGTMSEGAADRRSAYAPSMPDRRTRMLDAALAIVGESGTRGLTHRGIDRRLEVPDGSTSNYFRTRRSLLVGTMERLQEVDQATLTEIHRGFKKIDDVGLAAALAEFAVRQCRPSAITRARARFALTLVFPERLGGTLRAWLKLGVANLGHANPDALTRALLAYTEGVIYQAILDTGGKGTELDRDEVASHAITLIRGV